MADKWTAPRPDADEVPYWGVNDSFEEEGDDADADLDAEGRKKLTVRQQCLRLFSLVIFVVLFPFVVIALGAYRAASVVRGLFARRRRVAHPQPQVEVALRLEVARRAGERDRVAGREGEARVARDAAREHDHLGVDAAAEVDAADRDVLGLSLIHI